MQRSSEYYLSLLRQLVIADFKLRFQGSALGLMWSFLRPLLLFGVLYVVFNLFVKIGSSIENYALYLLIGIVLWGFFGEITKSGMVSIVRRGNLIKKVRFPSILIVIASSFNAGINLLISTLVVAIFVVFAAVSIGPEILLIPLLLFQLYIFGFGLTLYLSTLFVKYRDYQHVWDIALQAGFYGTPIIYPVDLVPESVQPLIFLNPLAQNFQDIRAIIIGPETIQAHEVMALPWLLIPYLAPFVIFITGLWFFRSRQKKFAEEV